MTRDCVPFSNVYKQTPHLHAITHLRAYGCGWRLNGLVVRSPIRVHGQLAKVLPWRRLCVETTVLVHDVRMDWAGVQMVVSWMNGGLR